MSFVGVSGQAAVRLRGSFRRRQNHDLPTVLFSAQYSVLSSRQPGRGTRCTARFRRGFVCWYRGWVQCSLPVCARIEGHRPLGTRLGREAVMAGGTGSGLGMWHCQDRLANHCKRGGRCARAQDSLHLCPSRSLNSSLACICAPSAASRRLSGCRDHRPLPRPVLHSSTCGCSALWAPG